MVRLTQLPGLMMSVITSYLLSCSAYSVSSRCGVTDRVLGPFSNRFISLSEIGLLPRRPWMLLRGVPWTLESFVIFLLSPSPVEDLGR